MTQETLTADELTSLVRRVFLPGPDDRALAILVDLPDDEFPDNPDWRERRQMAAGWVHELTAARSVHGLAVRLYAYRNVRSNNADLPPAVWQVDPSAVPLRTSELESGTPVDLEHVLADHQLVIAPTELSATAPLKMLAPRLGFRAATMPRFSPAMIPALRLDYTEVDRRVRRLAELLDRSAAADLEFVVDGDVELALHLDLRHRSAHASGGLFPEPGVAGNLPSGEAYIVPYEGEIEGDPTSSQGRLPIQHDEEVVVYRVESNRVVGVDSTDAVSIAEAERLACEPAAGNLAELGLGVLADFGVEPIGEVLLDEKLGLHVALGRSEHFGGQVGPAQFSRPEAVVHQDHVYLPQLQPRVAPKAVTLTLEDGSRLELMRDGRYVIDFDQ
jgi:hypothetical protein